MRPHHTVFVSARDGRLDAPVVDGDVAVVVVDWTTFDPHGDAHALLARAGVRYGLPAGLIRAAAADLADMGDADLRGHLPAAGPDRPWAYASYGRAFGMIASAGDGATVVGHDWSAPPTPATLVGYLDDLGRLGPVGRAAALERGLPYLGGREESGDVAAAVRPADLTSSER